MNFITRFVTTVFILPLTIAGAPAPEAKASMLNNRTDGEALIEELMMAGVNVNVSPCSNDKSFGWFAYNPGNLRGSEIQICTNVATTEAQRWETLRHEAVHVAQFCSNPNHGNSFETVNTWSFLKRNAYDSDAQFITSSYPQEKWAIELEAFTLMRQSNAVILNFVAQACR